MHSIGASIFLEVELENALEETSVIQLELEKEFGGTGPHLEVKLEKVFQLLWSLLYLVTTDMIACTQKLIKLVRLDCHDIAVQCTTCIFTVTYCI